MDRLFVVGGATVVLGLILAACGGGEGSPSPSPQATAQPKATAPGAPATLEVRVTDAPSEGVSKIHITAEKIEVNIAEAGTESGWQTVLPGPVSFDLVELTGVEGVLGEVQLAPGRYNQLRMDVVEALITIEGEEKSATAPSGKQ